MTGDPSSGDELVAVLAALANPIRWRIIGAHGRDYVSHLAREVVPEEVQALKSPPGGDIIVGGGQIAATFLRLGLVDELAIYVHPVVSTCTRWCWATARRCSRRRRSSCRCG